MYDPKPDRPDTLDPIGLDLPFAAMPQARRTAPHAIAAFDYREAPFRFSESESEESLAWLDFEQEGSGPYAPPDETGGHDRSCGCAQCDRSSGRPRARATGHHEIDSEFIASGLGDEFEDEIDHLVDPSGVQKMLALPGRFDDPVRDHAIEKDGTLFQSFLGAKSRKDFIAEWIANSAQLTRAAKLPDADFQTGDINKAWFVIHDVGVDGSLSDEHYKPTKFVVLNKKTGKRSVTGGEHGFLNRAGLYAATHDFSKNSMGTVYEFLSKAGKRVAGFATINIETVPDVEHNVKDQVDGRRGTPANADAYASLGYRKTYVRKTDPHTKKTRTVYSGRVTFYKWTKEALDALADLYILASARAGHLLTISGHKEMDRNLARSRIWKEYSAAEMRAGKNKFWDTARNHASNYHGDPYGFDMQAFYDLITAKLNRLAGAQMPMGSRYGIHPLRLRKADGEDVGNGDSQLHEFPWQSSPSVTTDKKIKPAGWWNAAAPAKEFADFADEALSDDGYEMADHFHDHGHAKEMFSGGDEETYEATAQDAWPSGDGEEFATWEGEAESADGWSSHFDESTGEDEVEREEEAEDEHAAIIDGETPVWRTGTTYFGAAAAGRDIVGIRRDDGQVLLAVNSAGTRVVHLPDAEVGMLQIGQGRRVSRCRRAVLAPKTGAIADAMTASLTGTILYVLDDGTEILRKSGSSIVSVPNGELPADLITRFYHGTRLDIASEPPRFRMTFRLNDETNESARWVRAKATAATIAARRHDFELAATNVPAGLRQSVIDQLDLLAVVSVIEGSFGAKSGAGDTAASLGIFQWAMTRNQWQETGSLGQFFWDLKTRAQAAGAERLFVDAWATCTSKGLDIVNQVIDAHERKVISLNGAHATGEQVETALAGAMATGNLASYQLVAGLDWINNFKDTIIAPGPLGRTWLGHGWTKTGAQTGRFVVGARRLDIASAGVTRLSQVFTQEASLATAVMLGVNRPAYVPLALWRALGTSSAPSAHVGTLLDTIFRGCEAAGQHPAKNHFTRHHVEAAGGDALKAFQALQEYLWPPHPMLPFGSEQEARTLFERKALLLYNPRDARKFAREGRFATVRVSLP